MSRAERQKICATCGKPFGCPYGIGAMIWARRQFCSKVCAAQTKRRDLRERIINNVVPDGNGCWIWQGALNRGGYGQMQINDKVRVVHRAAWLAFRGSIPPGLCICHRCDVRSCVNPEHLFLGTQTDNNADMDAKGRRRPPRGSAAGGARLTEHLVSELRQRSYPKWGDITAEARALRVDVKTLWCVLRGETWRHVSPAAANLPPKLHRLKYERKQERTA